MTDDNQQQSAQHDNQPDHRDITPSTAREASPVGPIHRGSCHCGALRFQVVTDPSTGASRCNCSICTKLATTAVIVKPEAFTLLTPGGPLGTYEWGGKISRRFFCRACGTHAFGRGHLAELGGDYVSVNANCLDDLDPQTLKVVYWDGRHDNWYAGPRETPWPIFTAAA